MSRPLRILVVCECSGAVRRAMRAKGADCYSCDLKAAEDGSPHHIQGDALEAIRAGCPTDGLPWDIVLSHPPCDYLTVSGNAWFSDTVTASPGILTGEARRRAQTEAVAFVRAIWECGVDRVAIENPIGRLSSLWMKPTMILQPTEYGAPFRKATCLWLKNLPRLVPSHGEPGDLFQLPEPEGVQAVWKMGPSATRKADRSRTYDEVARAMADAWACLPVFGAPSHK